MSGFSLGENIAANLLKVSFEVGSMPCSSSSMHRFALLISPVVTCLLASGIKLLLVLQGCELMKTKFNLRNLFGSGS